MNSDVSDDLISHKELGCTGSGLRVPAAGGRIKQWLNRALALFEYCVVCVMGLSFGISSVVRYLRNPNPRVTVRLLRKFGATIGNDTTLKGSVFIDNATGDENATDDLSHLKIGNNCYIGDGVFFDLASGIVIGDNAVIAGRVSFITHAECKRSPYLSQKFPRSCGPVTVGDGAWVGFGATLLHGTAVGENAAVGAHSLLRGDAEPQHLYVGNPARKLRRIE